MKKKYDIKFDEYSGFYQWNKKTCIIKKSDKRFKEYKKFRKKNGFSPDQCWNLYASIAIFVIPRLKYFRNNTVGYPTQLKSIEQWKEIIDKMIFSFQNTLRYDYGEFPNSYLEKYNNEKQACEVYYQDLKNGFELFGKYLNDLWW